MTKKMESRPREELPEVYRLAVILVICVIGGLVGYWFNKQAEHYILPLANII